MSSAHEYLVRLIFHLGKIIGEDFERDRLVGDGRKHRQCESAVIGDAGFGMRVGLVVRPAMREKEAISIMPGKWRRRRKFERVAIGWVSCMAPV